jgi:hypothetical protein
MGPLQSKACGPDQHRVLLVTTSQACEGSELTERGGEVTPGFLFNLTGATVGSGEKRPSGFNKADGNSRHRTALPPLAKTTVKRESWPIHNKYYVRDQTTFVCQTSVLNSIIAHCLVTSIFDAETVL